MPQAGVLSRSHDELLPRSPGGFGAGAMLALLAHAMLIAGLAFAVDWRTRDPEPVSAELWANVPRALAPESAPAQSPQVAPDPPAPVPPPRPLPPAEVPEPTPPAPTPPPVEAPKPPPEPDIATERAERRRLEVERKKAEQQAEAVRQRELAEQKLEKARKQAVAAATAKAQEKAEADKKRAEQEARDAAAEKRLAQQREDNLKRMMGEAGKATGTAGAAARPGAPSAAAMAAYTERLAALIRGNTIYSGNPPDNAAVVVEVRTAAGGTILSRRVLRGSGHADWDEAVLRAVDRTGALPANVDGKVPETLIIDFKPRE
jgi:colicin import membrane protein